ncbi:hypothetical protein [Nonomuraea jabiensis]|uniref:hypothetical protein n=1 Tax=Nonomuraea jabiensis TaxID=882448 RepID=UPI003D74224D
MSGHIWEQAAKEIAHVLRPLAFVGGDFDPDRRDLPCSRSTGMDTGMRARG